MTKISESRCPEHGNSVFEAIDDGDKHHVRYSKCGCEHDVRVIDGRLDQSKRPATYPSINSRSNPSYW